MRHPPFLASPEKTGADYSTLAGAQKLAAIIRAAWARCGHDVETVIVETQPGHPHTLYAVRMPGLVRGLPV